MSQFSKKIRFILVCVVSILLSFILLTPTVNSQSFSDIAQDFDFLNTSSNVGIVPGKPTSDPITRAWFIEKIKPGETIEQVALVVNNSEEALPVIVMAKDAIQTSEGGFSFKENDDIDTMVGSWIEFVDNPKLTVPAKSVTEVKFKIKVPEGTKPGEYAGVVAVQQDKSNEKRQGIQIVMRVGARVYITVPGELELNTKAKTFEFLTDNNQAYKDFLQRNRRANYKDIYLNVTMENAGNIFTKVSGKITMIDPSGEKFTTVYNKELAPNTVTADNRIPISGQQWKVGKYKAIFEWDNSPQITINKSNVKDSTPTKSVITEFEMTQEQLDRMAKLQAEADSDTKAPIPTPQTNQVKEEKPEETTVKEEKEEDNTLLYAVIGGLTGLVAAMSGVLVFFSYKNSKKNKEDDAEDVEENKKSEKTETTPRK